MTDDGLDESNTYPVFIDRDEAWNIVSNQIEVQEQLRTRGQQVLSILAAIAVVIAGISLSFDFSISESEFKNTLNSSSLSEADLRIILEFHQAAAAILLLISSLLIIFFIKRNYEASRHSPLKPGLGGREDRPIFVVTNSDYQSILGENQATARQYEEWISSNTKTLDRKRSKLNTANTDLYAILNSLIIAILLMVHASFVNVELLFYIDIIVFLEALFISVVLLKTRDKWLDIKSWPFTEKQKEDFPYLDTTEAFVIAFFTPWILISIGIPFYFLLIIISI